MDKNLRIKELVTNLNDFSYFYYALDNPKISDVEYDRLYDELKKLELETGIVLEDSPTQRVGHTIIEKFEKSTHKSKMWSLGKVNSFEELETWHNKNLDIIKENNISSLTYVVMKKFDGVSINLSYENGNFIKGATRGTGEIGENVTEQTKTIKGIPFHIDSKAIFEIRGEVIMTREAFQEYNKNSEVPLKNLRNGAAGALRNLDYRETKKRNLISYLFDIGYYEGIDFKTFEEMLIFLEDNKFQTCNYKVCSSIEEVKTEIKNITLLREDLDYDIDGVVITINELETRDILGYTVKHPKFSVAYKFEALEESTKLLDVEWNVSRSGRVNPTAILEPVDLGGITIKRATLNNMDDINRKGVKINSIVFIRRSNDVIPEILGISNVQSDNLLEIIPPKFCPACNTPLELNGVHIICNNSISCKPQIVKAIVHFGSRDAMNIEGFSEKIAEQFYEELGVKKILDLFKLKVDDLLKLDKFKDKKANNIIESIEKSKKCNLENFIYALGIKNVGLKTSKDIVKEYKTLDRIMNLTKEELLGIHGIGEIIIDEIINLFSNEKVKREIYELVESSGIIFNNIENLTIESEFTGKSIVVTGTMLKFSRKQIKDILERLGAKVTETVSKKTDFVIHGKNAGSKLYKAVKLNVKTLTEEEFNIVYEKSGI